MLFRSHIQSTGSSRQPIRDPPTCLHLPLPPGSTTTACLPYHPPSPALALAGHPLPAGRVVTPEQNQILSPPCFKFSVASSCVQNETRIPHRGTHSTRTADPLSPPPSPSGPCSPTSLVSSPPSPLLSSLPSFPSLLLHPALLISLEFYVSQNSRKGFRSFPFSFLKVLSPISFIDRKSTRLNSSH